MSVRDDPPGSDEPLVQPLDADSAQRAPGSATERDSPPVPMVAADSPEPSNRHDESYNMLPPRERRRSRLERFVVRLIATCGIVGIGVAIGAIMASQKSPGWIVGLVVSVVSVVLAALLWSSRQL